MEVPLEEPIRSAPAATIAERSSMVLMPPEALTFIAPMTAVFRRLTSWVVAPPVEIVEVLPVK